MKNIPDKSIDMILCDLPYGTTACKWDVVIPFEPLWKEYKRIIKDRGAIALFGSEPFSSALRMSNIKNYKYDWIWNKDKPSNFATANKQPMKYHEIISIFNSKTYYKQITTGHKKMNGQATYGRTSNLSVPDIKIKERYSGGKTTRNPSSIIKFNTCKHNTKDKSGFHPTQKPVALLEYLIKTYTLENETVLDNCMGSGSTGVACININRNFIGIEKDDKYFEIAKSRIEKAQQDVAPKV
jgi:DNA modification methylase